MQDGIDQTLMLMCLILALGTSRADIISSQLDMIITWGEEMTDRLNGSPTALCMTFLLNGYFSALESWLAGLSRFLRHSDWEG